MHWREFVLPRTVQLPLVWTAFKNWGTMRCEDLLVILFLFAKATSFLLLFLTVCQFVPLTARPSLSALLFSFRTGKWKSLSGSVSLHYRWLQSQSSSDFFSACLRRSSFHFQLLITKFFFGKNACLLQPIWLVWFAVIKNQYLGDGLLAMRLFRI